MRIITWGMQPFSVTRGFRLQHGTMELAGEIIEKVKTAARVRVRSRTSSASTGTSPVTLKSEALLKSTHKVIAIGASTGGTEALRDVLVALPANTPGVVIVQHMPEKFTHSFAERLNGICQMRVREAKDGDRILPGHV